MVVGVLLLLASPAYSEGDTDLARRRFATGQLLYTRGRYLDALREFEAARAVEARPPFDYNIGLCLEYLDRREEAADAFERFAAVCASDPEVGAVWKRIAQLRATTSVVSVQARALGQRTQRLQLAGAAATAFGGGALLASIPVGALALEARDEYHTGCSAGLCDTNAFRRGRALAMTTDALIGVGAVITVAGVAILALSARRSVRRTAEPAKGTP